MELLDVVSVEPLEGYRLLLVFEGGERRIFAMGPYLAKRPFTALAGPLFAMARVDYGTVVWPGGIDIAPETLYDKSTPAGLTQA